LYDRTGTKALKYLGGTATAMPLFSIFFFIFSLCNMALPLTPNFVGEFLCLCGIYEHNLFALCASLLGVLLSAAYTMWAYARVVHGMPKPTYFKGLADLNRREFCTLLPLLILTVWWGLKPELVLSTLSASLHFWQQTTSMSLGQNSCWAAVFLHSNMPLLTDVLSISENGPLRLNKNKLFLLLSHLLSFL
jgi:NADH:ubiquinone oxidoreductase subunit 4 (subunit M)